MVQLLHPYMAPGKTIALTLWTFVSKVISLPFNMLSSVCHSFSSKEQTSFNFICSDFGAQENKVCHCFHCLPIYLSWSDGTGWWEYTEQIIETTMNETNHCSDQPKLKIQIVHAELTSYHQLETKFPQILPLCFILTSVIVFLVHGLDLNMGLWAWLHKGSSTFPTELISYFYSFFFFFFDASKQQKQ